MFSGPIEDRLAIRELNDSYCDAVLRVDAQDWGKCWADDAQWSLMGTTVEGREAIVQMWSGAMKSFASVSFLGITCAVEVDGDRATGRVQTHEILALPDGGSRVVGGRYDDQYVKRDGTWLYASRRFSVVAEYQPKEA
ncbi:MAG: nuclear transport factor 2 family protein [Tsuneonella sp.]